MFPCFFLPWFHLLFCFSVSLLLCFFASLSSSLLSLLSLFVSSVCLLLSLFFLCLSLAEGGPHQSLLVSCGTGALQKNYEHVSWELLVFWWDIARDKCTPITSNCRWWGINRQLHSRRGPTPVPTVSASMETTQTHWTGNDIIQLDVQWGTAKGARWTHGHWQCKKNW